VKGIYGALALGILFSLSDVESAFTAYDVFLFLDNIALPVLLCALVFALLLLGLPSCW